MLKNKIFMALLSIAVAFGLWVYVVTVITPDYETTIYDIPVSIDSADVLTNRGENGEGLILMTDELPKVNLKLYGNRSDLNQLNNENIILKVDVSWVREAGEHALTYSISYLPGNINGNEIQVQNRDPGRIVLVYEDADTKKIPVIKPHVEAAEGYVVGEETLELEEVTVYGPVSMIGAIEQAVIKEDIRGLTDSFSETYKLTLCDARGNPVDVDERVIMREPVSDIVIDGMINYKCDILQCKTVPLQFVAVDAQGNPATNVVVTLEQDTIEVQGKKRVLEELESISLETVDVSKLKGTSSHALDIVLPAGVETVSGQTQVNVNIQVIPKVSQSFLVNNQQFQLTGVPKDLVVSYTVTDLVVKVYATPDELAKLKSADFVVEIDLSDKTQPGEYDVIPEVKLPDGYQIVNIPSIRVVLEEAP